MSRTFCDRPITEITARELRVGDVWCGQSSNPECTITEVHLGAAPLSDGTPMVRFAGLLGTRKKPITWRFRADQRMEVHRG